MQEEEGAPPLGFDQITVERESGGGGGGGGGSPAGNRWPRQETTALLKIRSDMDPLFQEATLKAPLWELISRKLREEGFQRSAKKCKEKFENVFKYYKRTKEARAGKSYRFFSQLEAFRTSAAAAAVLPPPIMSGSDTMVNIEATSSGAAAPSQHALFSITDPPPPPAPAPAAAVAHITTPAIAPPPTDGPSSSSNPSSYSGTESENESRRKRKRKLHSGDEAPAEGAKMMAFFEGLIQKVIDQQEKMLQKFLEAIERREQNRMIREEAWRRQEKSRLSKEHELASEERAAAASRDDAIVSFLEKLTGQKIPFPPPPPSPTAAGEETPTPTPPPPPPENHPVPAPKVTPLSSSRWPKPEVHALIKLRSGMELRYQESIPKGPLWEEISSGMLCLGYNRSAKRCKEKWENINKYFKKVKESTKSRRDDAKTCPYFHQLDALYRNKLTGGEGGGSSAAAEDRLSSVLAVKKPEDIVKKMEEAIVEDEFRIERKWTEQFLGRGLVEKNSFFLLLYVFNRSIYLSIFKFILLNELICCGRIKYEWRAAAAGGGELEGINKFDLISASVRRFFPSCC